MTAPAVDLVATVEGYTVRVTCLYDGAPIVPVAEGTTTGTKAQAVARCSVCSSEFLISAELLMPHGRKATGRRSQQL